jgi:dipeptidyl aminopeptidase/acylaminoacyl peptidase
MSLSRVVVGCSLGLVALTGCRNEKGESRFSLARGAKESRVEKQAADTLVDREVFFGNPERAGPALSPDGTKLAFIAPVDGVLNVWVGPADNFQAAQPVTKDTVRGIRRFFWAYTNSHIIYLQDKGGDENWRAYSVDLATKTEKDLTPLEGVRAEIAAVSHKFPNEILVSLNDRNKEYHDVHRINIQTGAKTLVEENNQFAGFMIDDSYNVRFAMKMTEDGGSEVFRKNGTAWQSFTKIPMADSLTTEPLEIDTANNRLYLIDSRDRDMAAFTAVDINTGAKTILGESKKADVDQVLFHPTTHEPQAFGYNFTRIEWKPLTREIKGDFGYLREVADGDFFITSRTLDDNQWIVAYTMDSGPVRYYRYNRANKDAKFLFTNNPKLENLTLATMTPVVIQSRDNKELVSYLTLPPWENVGRRPRPTEPLPMVLFVHGGPWGRDTWGFNSYHQWLANRGYAVLSVNFRGSTGFGKDFINAANLEWAGKMHDDLIDATDWAIKEKIADPTKVAIMGGSYGGYSTLVGLTFTPEKFACGVDIVGPSNLITLLNSIPPYWAPMIEMFTTRVGDHRTPEGQSLLRDRSPLTFVDRIKKPLLIGQGANDPRVKQAESDQIVQAMTAKKIPVTYVLYSDEGHGFARPENRLSFNAVAEAFLAENLGGRYQPIGDDFKNSTIKVPAGATDVPGLSQAIGGQAGTN